MSCTAIAKWTRFSRSFSVFCGTLNTGPKLAASCTSGKSSAGSVCRVKRLLPPLSISLLCAGFEAHRLVGRHGAQDVDQLARADGGGEVAFVAAELGRGADLDLEVAGGELRAAAGLADQHVGQDRQRMAPLHDAATDCRAARTLSWVPSKRSCFPLPYSLFN